MPSGFDALFDEPFRPEDSVYDFVGRSVGDCTIEELVADQPASQVYIARDNVLNRRVAVKLLKQGYWLPSDASNRFRAEGKILARIRHPGVVQIYGFHELDSLPCLLMEYVPDGTLTDYLDAPVSPRDAAVLLLRVARGVAAAHRNGIVHRDIKPQNILIDSSIREPALATFAGFVKVTDFGIAQVLQDFETVTRTGMQPGTVLHMAPEQIESSFGGIGPATDVFALGVLLFRMISGGSPFQGASTPSTLQNIVREKLPDLSAMDDRTPEWLNQIFRKSTEKHPLDRYETAEELAVALELQLRPTSATSRGTDIALDEPVRSTNRGFVFLCLAMILLSISLLIRGCEQPAAPAQPAHPAESSAVAKSN